MRALALALAVAFAAELGDKTQLLVLALATRYRPWPVFTGVAIGTFAIMGASVAVGAVLGAALPTSLVTGAAGLLFLAFAVWSLREAPGHGEAEPVAPARVHSVVLGVAAAIFVAELGDKTMLAALALGATQDPVLTWAGAGLGMLLACSLALLLGSFIGGRVPERVTRYGSAALFAVFGAILLTEAIT